MPTPGRVGTMLSREKVATLLRNAKLFFPKLPERVLQ